MENNNTINLACTCCSTKLNGNFCSVCGQKKFKRIDKKYVLDEVQYTILHTNKGLFYTLKHLIKNPGQTARSYIDGNRVLHYKPLSLAFLISGISAFLSYKVLHFNVIVGEYYDQINKNSAFMNDTLTFIASNNSLGMLALLPFFALCTKMAFKKMGHNYYEHIILNAYIFSLYSIFYCLICYPVIFFKKHDLHFIMDFVGSSILVIIPILIWFFRGFYPNLSLNNIIKRTIYTSFWVLLGYASVVLLTVIFMVGVAVIKGPESMHYFTQK